MFIISVEPSTPSLCPAPNSVSNRVTQPFPQPKSIAEKSEFSFGNANFSVDANGVMVASGATIAGTMTITSGAVHIG